MKNSRIILMFLLIAAVIAVSGYFGIKYLKNKQLNTEVEAYTPEEEITDEQMRRTMVSLYFYNNETGELSQESRLIDAVELLENPYGRLVELLIEGPKNDKLKTLMPDGVKLNSAVINDNCVTVDVSSEFLNHTEDKDLKTKMVKSIVNTLTELTEVEKVKFLIEGEKNAEFSEDYVRQ